MTPNELIVNLECWAEYLENPTYNSLEVGFRHSPLSKDEIIQRYKQECDFTVNSIRKVIEIIQNEGIQNGNS
jgi:hypothetical protein